MSLWVFPDQVPGLHPRVGLLPVADSSLSGEISPVCQVNSGLNEEKHQHISTCTGYILLCPDFVHTHFFVPVVCPSFGFGFNTKFLASLNITDEDYKKGSWIGNYSLNPVDSEIEMIYKNSTLDVEKGINNE